jgi:hypothetical protein
VTRPLALAIALIVTAAGLSGLADRHAPSAAIDLIARFDAAEKRAPAGPVTVLRQTIGGSTRQSIVTPAVSRIVWHLTIPKGAELRTAIALDPATRRDARIPVLFRIGIADDRTYEELYSTRLQAGPKTMNAWVDVNIDLRAYAGFQWSLFYRPDGRQWSLIFETRPARRRGTGAKPQWRALWAAPGIYGPE